MNRAALEHGKGNAEFRVRACRRGEAPPAGRAARLARLQQGHAPAGPGQPGRHARAEHARADHHAATGLKTAHD